jgi:hypothetical protein
LLYQYILDLAEEAPGTIEVYWGSAWPSEEMNAKTEAILGLQTWRDRLDRVLGRTVDQNDRSVTHYVLLDEGQATYWDLAFWNEFIKSAQNVIDNCRIVLFCVFGNSVTSTPQGTRPMINEEARISIRPPKQSQKEQPTLLFTRNEYDEMLRKRGYFQHLDEPLQTAIYDWTSGHSGAVYAMYQRLSQNVGYRPYRIERRLTSHLSAAQSE